MRELASSATQKDPKDHRRKLSVLRQNYFHEKEILLNIFSSQKRSEEAFKIRRHERKYNNKVQPDGYTQEQEHEIRLWRKTSKRVEGKANKQTTDS